MYIIPKYTSGSSIKFNADLYPPIHVLYVVVRFPNLGWMEISFNFPATVQGTISYGFSCIDYVPAS